MYFSELQKYFNVWFFDTLIDYFGLLKFHAATWFDISKSKFRFVWECMRLFGDFDVIIKGFLELFFEILR